MTKWDHIIIEGYCQYEYAHKKQHTLIEIDDDMNEIGRRVTKNDCYINAKRPEWCLKEYPKNTERTPEHRCLEFKCPFFAWTPAEEADSRIFQAAFDTEMNQCLDGDGEVMPARVDAFIEHITKFRYVERKKKVTK